MMKGNVGMLRYACTGRQIKPSHLRNPLSSSHAHSISVHRIHTSTATALSAPTRSLFSEHALDPTTSSSSSRNSPPIPPPSAPKKRSTSSRQTLNAQSRPAGKFITPTGLSESKERTTSQAKESLPLAEANAEPTAQSSQNSVSSTSIAKETSTTSSSTPPNGKEPSKTTLMEKIKGLWENVKYLFRFYYQGTKQIWKDRAIVADLRRKIIERQAKGGEGIQWIESAVITRHESDLRKLPLFLAILLILEEILPLVVIYAPSLLPSTCVLPSQSIKMRSEEERKRGLAIQALAKNDQVRVVVDQLASQSEAHLSEAKTANVQTLSVYGQNVIGEVAKLFALSSWGPATLVSSRIEKHLNKLQSDDQMLKHAYESKDTSSQWKEIKESNWLWQACAQRGLRAFEADSLTMEHNLIAYLHLATKNLTSAHRSLLPLALYDGTLRDLIRLQGEAKQEASKGIRRRTLEVVEEVKEAEKKKEVKSQ